MTKVVKFPDSGPAKFGPVRVRKKRGKDPEKEGQLNLFTGGRIVKLNQLSAFDEGLMLDDKGDFASAKLLYIKCIESGECLCDAYCNLGIIESELGNYPKAIDYFTLCLKHEPRHYEAHYNLANLYAEVGNLNLAKIHYGISIEIEPTFPNNYYNLGLALAINKEYKDAIKVLAQYKQYACAEESFHADNLMRQLSIIDNQ